MSGKHSQNQQRSIIERLIANGGNIARTAAEFGISTTTIYRWLKKPEMQQMLQMQLQHFQHLSSKNATGVALGANVENRLRVLQEEMLTSAELISRSVTEGIEEAPLNQRVMALAQLIDRVVKLGAQVPAEPVVVVVHNAVEEDEDDEDNGFDPAEDSSQSEEDSEIR